MPDETNTAPEATTPTTPEVTAPETTTTTTTATAPEATAAESELKQARKDAAAYRTRLREIEAKLAAHEQAAMTETEKRDARLAELEKLATERDQQLRDVTLKSAVSRQARALSIIDDDAAYALLDRAAIQYDADGNPQNLPTLMAALVKAKPWLVQPTSTTSAANPSKENPADREAEIRRVLFGNGSILDAATAPLRGGGVVGADS